MRAPRGLPCENAQDLDFGVSLHPPTQTISRISVFLTPPKRNTQTINNKTHKRGFFGFSLWFPFGFPSPHGTLRLTSPRSHEVLHRGCARLRPHGLPGRGFPTRFRFLKVTLCKNSNEVGGHFLANWPRTTVFWNTVRASERPGDDRLCVQLRHGLQEAAAAQRAQGGVPRGGRGKLKESCLPKKVSSIPL